MHVKERYYEKFRKSTKDNASGAGPSSDDAPINVQVLG